MQSPHIVKLQNTKTGAYLNILKLKYYENEINFFNDWTYSGSFILQSKTRHTIA